MTVHEPASQSQTVDVLCPHCGYNLRGHLTNGDAAGGRCSECGETFLPGELSTSRIPWVHRKKIGRLRAFLKTIYLATFRSHILGQSREEADGRWSATLFRWICALLIWLPLGCLCSVPVADLYLVPIAWLIGGNASIYSQWSVQILYPWTVVFRHWYILLPVSLCLCLSMAMAPVRVVAFAVFPDSVRKSVLTSSQYLVGAFIGGTVLGLLASAVLYGVSYPLVPRWGNSAWRLLVTMFLIFTPATALVCWGLACTRFFRHAAVYATGRRVLLTLFFPPSVLLILGFWLVFVPWCAGLLYFAITGLLH